MAGTLFRQLGDERGSGRGASGGSTGDYSIRVKVSNARIKRRMLECGYRSVNEMCRKAGLEPARIYALFNLKVPPLTSTGTWCRAAVELADALGCTSEELFSATQRTLALRSNQGECFVTEAEMLQRCGRDEQPLLEDPGERLLDDADEHTKTGVIRRALDAMRLRPRDRIILESYFGIGCHEKTLADLASEFGVSRSFIEFCLKRTLRRLREYQSPSRRALLQAYLPVLAMGRTDETRLSRTQERAARPALTSVRASREGQSSNLASHPGTRVIRSTNTKNTSL